jgi:hypothetical protein
MLDNALIGHRRKQTQQNAYDDSYDDFKYEPHCLLSSKIVYCCLHQESSLPSEPELSLSFTQRLSPSKRPTIGKYDLTHAFGRSWRHAANLLQNEVMSGLDIVVGDHPESMFRTDLDLDPQPFSRSEKGMLSTCGLTSRLMILVRIPRSTRISNASRPDLIRSAFS